MDSAEPTDNFRLPPGYACTGIVRPGPDSYLLRARRDGANVLIKVPGPTAVDWNRRAARDYELSAWIDSTAALKAVQLVEHEKTLLPVFAEFNGEPLKNLVTPDGIKLKAFLRIALRLCAALEDVHRSEIIHNDFQPANVLVDVASGEIRITGFGQALLASALQAGAPTRARTDLNYISPEQTGRINRPIDLRSDYYSLGAVLYELLCGRPPFMSDDPLELIHAHVAHLPVAPHTMRPELPPVISNILLRLLAKSADDRYRGLDGLANDLKECLRQMRLNGTVQSFHAGAADYAERYYLPRRLFGRDAELQALLAEFERSAAGRCVLTFVCGNSGIGKSALIREMSTSIVKHRGNFIEGKFDQFQRDLPYSAIIQAVRMFVRALLTAPDARVAEWKDKHQAALSNSAAILIDAIPELQWLLEKSASATAPVETENNNLFHLACLEFFQAVATSDEPLVLFLDDLQWADLPSLKLLRVLLRDLPQETALHIVGAYRDNEVDAAHPLYTLEKNYEPRVIRLGRLSTAAMHEFVAESLRTTPTEAASLSEIVASFSGGNPFFAGEFLKSLIEDGRLRFHRASRAWRWDTDAIRSLTLTEGVVDFLSDKIRKLDPATRDVLNIAACFGNYFDKTTIAAALEPGNTEDVERHLLLAARLGLIMIVDSNTTAADETATGYHFIHDRIHQTIYELMSDDERMARHLSIGRALLRLVDTEDFADHIFEITNHLNLARSLISNDDERIQLAGLNLAGGRKAVASNAYDSAARLLTIGTELIPDDCWVFHFSLTLDLYGELANAEQLCGNHDRAEEIVQEILKHAHDPLQRVAAFETRIRALNNQNRLADALSAARQILRELGIRLPEQPGVPHVLAALLSTRLTIRMRGGKDYILRAPEMRNAKIRAALGILNYISPAAYQSDQNLFAVVIMFMTRLSYRYGLTAHTPYAVALYAVSHAGPLAKPVAARAYSDLSLGLLERVETQQQRARVLTLRGAFVSHWTSHARDTFSVLESGAEHARSAGDMEFRGYCFFFKSLNQFCSTARLPELHREMETYFREIKRHRSSQSLYVQAILLQTVDNLREGKAGNEISTVLRGEFFDQQQQLPGLYELNFRTAIAWVHQANALLLYLNDQPEVAFAAVLKSLEFLDGITATSSIPPLFLIEALCRLRLSAEPTTTRAARRAHRKAVARIVRQFRAWAKFAPTNQKHRLHLLNAGLYAITNKTEAASQEYERAIQSAAKSDFIFDVALASERAGEFYTRLERPILARAYLEAGADAYETWGCPAKAAGVRARAAAIQTLPMAIPTRQTAAASDRTVETSNATSHTLPETLEVGTVMKAVETISEEIQLDHLLDKLMHILMENSGARRGALIVCEDSGLQVVARRNVDEGEARLAQPEPVVGHTMLPEGLVQYVARTRESVVVNSMNETAHLPSESYFELRRPQSALCAPIVHQNQLYGVFYLENELAPGVFDQKRTSALKFLTTHIAISLRNARLYREQQDLSQSFARFLPNQFLEFLEKKSVRDVRLGDAIQQEMIVLFSDIRNFTTLSESMNARDNFRFLNSYFKRMEPAVLRNQGFVDKFIGDAVMALFSYSPENALTAAMEMRHEMEAFNRHRKLSGLAGIDIGIGLHIGEVMLGTVGSTNRLETTVIGDTVNLASRVESLTKKYDIPILLTGELYKKLAQPEALDLREVDSVRVKGKHRPVVLYELYEVDPPEIRAQKKTTRDLFTQGLWNYKAGDFEAASHAFDAALKLAPLDRMARVYSQRCASLMIKPPTNWEGVLDM